jgi:hypothetical protein
MKKKVLTTLTCILGIAGVFYGILSKHNGIFIVGILFVTGGYFMIRKELKEPAPTNERESSHEDTEKNQ